MKEKNKEDGNKKDNKKIITNFEYKNNIIEEPEVNIIYSEDKKNINYMSLELLISELNDNNLSKSNKNIIYNEILTFLVYQKNAIMEPEIFARNIFKYNRIFNKRK